MKAHVSPLALWFLLPWLAGVGEARAKTVDSQPADRAPDVRELAEKHFGAGRFLEAQLAYQEALEVVAAEEAETRAVLHFNLASCLFELGDFLRAEEHFLRAGQLHASLAPEAELHAGFAALRRGELSTAERRLEHSSSAALGDELNPLSTLLAKAIAEERAYRRELSLTKAWKAADAALASQDYQSAGRLYAQCLTFTPILSPAEEAYFHRRLALVARQENNTAEEVRRLSLALELAPHPLDFVERGYARVTQGAPGSADEDLLTATETGLDDQTQAEVKAVRQSLRPLPRAGVSGWISTGLGYDSNAAQSGSAAAIGVAALDDTGSPLLSVRARAGWTFRSGVDWSITPAYQVQGFFLTDAEVSAQSLQEHEALVSFGYAPDLRSRWRAGVGAAAVAVGVDPVQLFSTEGIGRISYLSENHRAAVGSSFWLLSGEFRAVRGQNEFEYMTGSRTEIQGSYGLTQGPWAWSLLGQLRYYGIGQIDYPITLDELYHCAEPSTNERCLALSQELASYSVPLGYASAALGGSVQRTLGDRWRVSARPRLEYRHYLEQSFATLDVGGGEVFGTRKRRRDLRGSLSVSGRYALNQAGSLGLVGDVSLLGSLSNMGRETPRSTASSAVELNPDYDNRNFVQHTSTVSLDFTF